VTLSPVDVVVVLAVVAVLLSGAASVLVDAPPDDRRFGRYLLALLVGIALLAVGLVRVL
jgi:hypothetical protein